MDSDCSCFPSENVKAYHRVHICRRLQQNIFVVGTLFSSDAATSACWQHSKLHSTQVASLYLLRDSGRILDYSDFVKGSYSFKLFCDLQRVRDSSAKGTFWMLVKQLRSIGCPIWPLSLGGEDFDINESELRLIFPVSDGGEHRKNDLQ